MKKQLAKSSPAKKENKTENKMRAPYIEKVVLSCGATGEDLVKSKKLLELVSASKAQIIKSSKRIPDFGVRPGLEVGTRVTLRDQRAIELLKRLLGAIDNKLKKKQVSDNHFSFGIEEYIEIPGMEYQRDIGIRGLNATVVFSRSGHRIKIKKIKSGKIPKRQQVTKQEIINYMGAVYKTEFN
ncbi:MAG: 50S ribosomal protein L5 [Nanoarchaeota archaeon]